jgi:5'-methylthioadenosine phosphorylase
MAERPAPKGWHIGILGGSGLYHPGELEEAQQIAVASPFGAPSGPVTMGALEGVKVTFLPRHGPHHTIPPSEVNYRANIDVLKRCGVTDVLAVSAIGSLREDLKPGEFVVPDQFIDRTLGRERSFFGEGVVAHVALADPVCPRLSKFAADAAKKAGAKVHRGGTYVAIEGPQFSTRAESLLFRQWGADVIGMTGMPEARLAREAELPFAMLAMVTDYDAWRDSEAGVEAAEILAAMRANADTARRALAELARALPEERPASPIDRALDAALVSPRSAWSHRSVARLDAVMRRLLAVDSAET